MIPRLSAACRAATILGAIVFPLILLALPAALVRLGWHPRSATGMSLGVMMLVGPWGLLAFGGAGLLLQTLRATGWPLAAAVVVFATLTNGFVWGALVEIMAGAWSRRRGLFWAVLIPLIAYEGFALALWLT